MFLAYAKSGRHNLNITGETKGQINRVLVTLGFDPEQFEIKEC